LLRGQTEARRSLGAKESRSLVPLLAGPLGEVTAEIPPAVPAQAIRNLLRHDSGLWRRVLKRMVPRSSCAVAEAAKKNRSMGHVPPFSLQSPSCRIAGILPRNLCDADIWSILRRAQPPLGLHKVTFPRNKLSYLSGRVDHASHMTTSSVCGFNRYISDTGLVVAQGADFARRAQRGRVHR